VSTVLDGKAKAGKSMEAHKGQESGNIKTIENIIQKWVSPFVFRVVVGDGFEPSKA
jgi:hypothetical protein